MQYIKYMLYRCSSTQPTPSQTEEDEEEEYYEYNNFVFPEQWI